MRNFIKLFLFSIITINLVSFNGYSEDILTTKETIQLLLNERVGIVNNGGTYELKSLNSLGNPVGEPLQTFNSSQRAIIVRIINGKKSASTSNISTAGIASYTAYHQGIIDDCNAALLNIEA